MSEHTPITTELRETIRSMAIDDSVLTIGGDDFHRLCDAIDAVHAGLERENAELRQRVAVLDKRSENMHEISSATVTITDELRKWGYGFCGDTHDVVTAIADRIDAEHEAQLNDAFETRNSDENLESDGWVRLPVDADGVPLHIGELVDESLPFGGYAAPAPVDTMELSRGASGYGWMVKLDAENRALISPKLLRHHHEPTVEDVLTKFGIDWEYEDNCEDRAALLAEYAKRLTLAGDAE